ncbi:MAG: pectate lyase [Bacteroidales bacterium]|nr:pectate lyase [Bacteroidales bacterium]
MLLYQRNIGGWPKNLPMHHVLNNIEKTELLESQAVGEGATTDNDATVMELTYLSSVFGATGNESYKAASLKGIDDLMNWKTEYTVSTHLLQKVHHQYDLRREVINEALQS